MKRITITEHTKDLDQVFALADTEPVMLLAPNGKQYVLAPVDEFEEEVEQLRRSDQFHQFLSERSSKKRPRRPLAEIIHETEQELADEENGD